EGDARVRPDGHRRRPPPGLARRVEHPPVAAVDAVEGADRDGALRLAELGRVVRDPHVASRASACSGGRIVSGAASSTENGPTSVRRRVRQCPPRASAIARTYVPDPTRRAGGGTRPA